MSKTMYENLLAKFIKANKVRREKIAKNNGYDTADEYRFFLEQQIHAAGESVVTEMKTVHVVDVIDCSASMRTSDKLKNAVNAVNSGIEELKTDSDVIHTYSLTTFSDSNSIIDHIVRKDPKKIGKQSFRTRGMTALYDAVGRTINKFREFSDNGEKVLMNIYTDGMENASYMFNAVKVSQMIEQDTVNMVVTFIGTEADTRSAINKLKIKASNTLSYDGTGEGLKKSMMDTLSARKMFSAKVAAGQDVSEGFYKEVINKG